jgi:DNA-binding IclR family transcriptional regulator
VTDTARNLGIPKSTASRLLKGMRDAGLLANAGNSPRYRVGPLIFEVAHLHRISSTLIEVVDEHLAAICKEVGHTGYVSILDGADVLVIRVHPGRSALRVVTALGHRSPAYATATGRALLARLSDAAVATRYPEPLSPPSPSAPADLGELFRRLKTVREQGWAEAIDEAVPAADSLAIAVADADNAETLSFCVTFPQTVVDAAEKQRILGLLMSAAQTIGKRVGDPMWIGTFTAGPDGRTTAASWTAG